MKHPDSVLLYVDDTASSAAFFHALFAVPIVEQSANFAMLALPSGVMLGLWALRDVSPKPAGAAGGFELLVTLENEAATNAALAEATALKVPIVQNPVHLDFGYTFVVQSPDGHLIRVFNPPETAAGGR